MVTIYFLFAVGIVYAVGEYVWGGFAHKRWGLNFIGFRKVIIIFLWKQACFICYKTYFDTECDDKLGQAAMLGKLGAIMLPGELITQVFGNTVLPRSE